MQADMRLGDTQEILSACMRQGLLRNQAAYVLATAYWETARTMKPVEEAFWLSEAWRKENLRYYPWHGRGYVQLTWEANYHKASAETGVDLIADPAKAMQPDIAAQILVAGMRDGWFTGKRLDDYITLKASNYRGARRIVNGTDKAAAIAEIAREYEEALLAEGYGIEAATPIRNENRDGTPAKQTPAQSTTLWAAITSGMAMVANASDQIKAFLATATDTLGVSSEFVILMIGFAAVLWIMRERLRKFFAGDDL